MSASLAIKVMPAKKTTAGSDEGILQKNSTFVMNKKDNEALVLLFMADIQSGCHRVSTEVGRSDAAKVLMDRGQDQLGEVLVSIGKYLERTYPPGTCVLEHDIGFNASAEAWLTFLWRLARIYAFKKSLPYTSQTQFGKQCLDVWAVFCLNPAKFITHLDDQSEVKWNTPLVRHESN